MIVVASALVLSHILFSCFTGPIRNMVLYNRSALNTLKSHFIFKMPKLLHMLLNILYLCMYIMPLTFYFLIFLIFLL